MTVAAFSDGCDVSLPSEAGGVDLAEALPESDRVMLRGFEQSLFVPASEFDRRCREDPVRPHWDPVLKSDVKLYTSFLLQLHSKRLLSFTLEPH